MLLVCFMMVSMVSFLKVLPVSAVQREFFVATNGNDNNPGTEELPFLTINKAVSVVEAGDTIYVREGIYDENVFVTKQGTPNAWITFKNYPGETPHVKSTSTAATLSDGVFLLEGAAYIEINGFILESTAALYSAGVKVRSDNGGRGDIRSHHVRIYNNVLCNNGEAGVSTGEADYIFVKNNRVYGNCTRSEWNGSGISLAGGLKYDDEPGWHNIIEGNIVYDNYVTKDFPLPPANGQTDGNGIIIDWSGANVEANSPNYLIQNNIVFDNGGRGIQLTKSYNCTVINNTSYKNSKDPDQMYTFVEFAADNGGNHHVIRNNIFYSRGDDIVASYYNLGNDIITENNCYYNGNGEQENFLGVNPIRANPHFVNASTDPSIADFTLKDISPCIDAGITGGAPVIDFWGTERPQNAGIDIGACEFSGVPAEPVYDEAPEIPIPPATEITSGGTTANLVGHWTFDEAVETQVLDSSANNTTGQINGPAVIVEGKTGSAMRFNGDSYISFPEVGVLKPTDEVTVAAWVALTAQPRDYTKIVWLGDASRNPFGAYGLELLWPDSGNKQPAFKVSTNDTDKKAIASESLQLGQWYHLTGVYKDNRVYIYVNGVLKKQTYVIGPISDYGENFASLLAIGGTSRGDSLFIGQIDDVRIYDRALSAEDVADLTEETDLANPTVELVTIEEPVETGNQIVVKKPKRTIIKESFDDDSVLPQPFNGPWAALAKAEIVAKDGGQTGDKCVKISHSAAENVQEGSIDLTGIESPQDIAVYEFSVKDMNKGFIFNARDYLAMGGNDVAFTITRRGEDKVGYSNGAETVNISNVSGNDWHKFVVVADINLQTYDIYVDEVLKVTGARFANDVPISQLQYKTPWGAVTEAFFDDIKVTYAVSTISTDKDFSSIYSESFDNATAIQWPIVGPWAESGRAEILAKDGGSAGDKCVKVSNVSTSNIQEGTVELLLRDIGAPESIAVYEFSLKDDNKGFVFAILDPIVQDTVGFDASRAIQIERKGENTISCNDGTASKEINNVSGDWHKYRVVVDIEASVYDLYIDDVLKAKDCSFTNPVKDIAKIQFKTPWGKVSDMYLDDIKVDYVIESEPEENFAFKITDSSINTEAGITASVKVSPVPEAQGHDGEETVVFELMDGNTPVSIIAMKKDITSQEHMTAYFNVSVNDTHQYTVRVFVLDQFNRDTSAAESLAEAIILQ